MTARRSSPTVSGPAQPSFFDERTSPPIADMDAAIRETLGESLALAKVNLGLDRHAIAAEVNRLQPIEGRELTKNMLDRFCAPGSTDWQLPAWRIPALCRATGDYRLLTLIVEACDHRSVPAEAAKIAELVMLELEAKRLRDRKASLRRSMSPEEIDWASRQVRGETR